MKIFSNKLRVQVSCRYSSGSRDFTLFDIVNIARMKEFNGRLIYVFYVLISFFFSNIYMENDSVNHKQDVKRKGRTFGKKE